MEDTKFTTLSGSLGNTVGPIHLKFRHNLRIAKMYLMQISCIRISVTVFEILTNVCHRQTARRKIFYCIFGIRDPQNGYFP
ncbi:hypothetical protein O3M35_000404 [Rhynocoris fuscipes]|uniref:Uncharacterized protein n=1 Tax=Rhynocoris fuscipes TaxID=488301 RepID=A0AAW1DLJ6_9HEMI